ncbi:MAG: molybdenum cofactor guanylyltransferase [Pseudohongiella sp.]|uniref:molybdenum cofactor guanylyltransferase n=1 Tax=Pseudohongiella sp. TaxID=1979412 RepID=UPI0034A0220F
MPAMTGPYTLIILCGGEGSRMGGADKGWLTIAGIPFVSALLDRFADQPQVNILISANRHRQRYAALGYDVLSDLRSAPCGPLAGIEACIHGRQAAPVVVIPCDMPNVPSDLPERLLASLNTADDIAVVHDGRQDQPLCCAFYPRRWADDLSAQLDHGHYGVRHWLRDKPVNYVHFGNTTDFMNVNNPAELMMLNGKTITTAVTKEKIRYTLANDRYKNTRLHDLPLARRIPRSGCRSRISQARRG